MGFAKARFYKATLQAGDMLYIPRKWWHQVESPAEAGRNLAVNYWWYMGGFVNGKAGEPFTLPPQPENYPFDKRDLTSEGEYGGYKLKWPEKLACRSTFQKDNMAEV